MSKRIIQYSFGFFLLFTSLIYAETMQQCPSVAGKVENKEYIFADISNKHTQIYFIHNKTLDGIFIERSILNGNPGASAGWSTYIRPGHWSVLALNKKYFAIHCATIKPGKVIPLDCANTILVCRPPALKIASKLKGSFWLAEDRPWENLQKILANKGVTY